MITFNDPPKKKQLEYQQYLENPKINGLRFGSSLMRGQIRLENEPFAERGIRWWIKQKENSRLEKQ